MGDYETTELRILLSMGRNADRIFLALRKASETTLSYNKRRACKGAMLALAYGSSFARARRIYAAYLYGDDHKLAR